MIARQLLTALCGTILIWVLFITLYSSDKVHYLKNILSFRKVEKARSDFTPAQSSLSNDTNTSSTTTTSRTANGTKSSTTTSSSSNSSTWTTIPMIRDSKRLFVTTNFMGRLGNHIFQYASLIGIARSKGREPYISSGEDMESLFQLSHIRKDIKSDNWAVIGESKIGTFESKFMKLPPQNIIIAGYLQSWRYFQHAEEDIRKEYTFKADIQKKVQTTLALYRNRRENHVLVGVHVRRGDFLNPYRVKLGYGVANASYFIKAFGKISSLLSNQNITFLVASDDLDWCKNNLNDNGIEILPQGSPADHFAILSSCDHTIITGGTYGWWIGWLANGITIYFKNYYAKGSELQWHFNDVDYYPIGWIGLEN